MHRVLWAVRREGTSLICTLLITLSASDLISVSGAALPGYVAGWVFSPTLPFLFSLHAYNYNLLPFKSAWFFDLMDGLVYRKNVYEVNNWKVDLKNIHIKVLGMSHSLSETSNYTSIKEAHWGDETVNRVAWLATEERSGTNREVDVHTVLGRHRIWSRRMGRMPAPTPGVWLLNWLHLSSLFS